MIVAAEAELCTPARTCDILIRPRGRWRVGAIVTHQRPLRLARVAPGLPRRFGRIGIVSPSELLMLVHLHSPALGPTVCLLGWVLGAALQLQQARLWPIGAYALIGAGLMLVLLWALRRRHVGRNLALPVTAAGVMAAILAVVAAGLSFAQTGARAAWFAAQALPSELEGRDLRVLGRIDGLPRGGVDALRFELRIEQAWLDDRPVHWPARIELAWYSGRGWSRGGAGAPATPEADGQRARQQALHPPASLQPGERWLMTVRLKAPHGQRNPHGFDHELRLWERGVQAVGYVRTTARDRPPEPIAAAEFAWVDRARLATRQAIAQRIADPSLAGVIAALVMGDQSAIERADWDVFRATGVAHLMSISGLHITLFAWLSGGLIAAAWRRSARWGSAACLALPAHVAGRWGGLLMALAYAVFSGWAVPAQRTVWMLAVAVLLRASGVRWPWPQVWLAAMAVVIGLDPWALHQAGFWLSFVAVGLLFASDEPPRRSDPTASRLGVWRQWLAALARLLREQWIMTLALSPLVLVLFQQVSLLGLLANALAIPWVTLAVTPLALMGVLLPPAWSLAAALLDVLMQILGFLSQASWAVLERAAAPWWCAVAGLLGGLLMVMRWPLALRSLGLPLMLPVLLWQPARPPPGAFEVLAFDVGQGSAVLVRTAGYSLLYDAGPRYSRESDAGHRVLVPALRAMGERPQDLVLSHSDSDHIGGARALLAAQPQMQVISSLAPDHELLRQPVQATACRAGQRWQRDGVSFEILHPNDEEAARLRKPNALSCVLHVQGVHASALLTGDLEAAQEAALVERASVRADWMLVPHHGSRTSSSAALLDAVQPRWAVVQAAYRNRFGHPAGDVMARYQARRIEVVQSSVCGAATWRSDDPQAMDCLRQRVPRYWQHRPPAQP
jgi:competence protein ComEC